MRVATETSRKAGCLCALLRLRFQVIIYDVVAYNLMAIYLEIFGKIFGLFLEVLFDFVGLHINHLVENFTTSFAYHLTYSFIRFIHLPSHCASFCVPLRRNLCPVRQVIHLCHL